MPTLGSKEVQKCQWDQAKFLSDVLELSCRTDVYHFLSDLMSHEHAQGGDAVRFGKRQLSSLLGSMLERLTLRDRRCAAGVPWQVKRLSPYCRAREYATLTWTPHPHSCGEVPTSSTRTSNMRDLVCLEWSCLGSRRIKPNLFTDRRGSLHQHCARLLKASHKTTFNCFFGIGRGMLAMIGRHVLESLASTVLILR